MNKKIIKLKSMSLSAKIEQFAAFLRTTTKKEPITKKRIYSKGSPNLSSANVIQQIAKKIRTEINERKNRKNAA